ncbi:MAG: hypothetical protein GY696_38545 [Gammaproteobacteria bacterium]|nr:hypothetical protein [Gammaproteobacteria bacterium]
MKLLDIFRKVKAQKTHTTIKMALMNCGELKNYHDTMIEEVALAKLHTTLSITTQPKFCPVCECHGITDLKRSPLMDKPGNHFHQSSIQDRFTQMLKASSIADISKLTYKCDVCKEDHKINDKLLDRADYRTVIMAQKLSRSELNTIRDLINLRQHIDLITIEDGDISDMYWALNADFSGFKAKLRVIYIEPGLQEVKTNAKQNDVTDHAIIMDVRMKLSALDRLVTQWNRDNMFYPIQLSYPPLLLNFKNSAHRAERDMAKAIAGINKWISQFHSLKHGAELERFPPGLQYEGLSLVNTEGVVVDLPKGDERQQWLKRIQRGTESEGREYESLEMYQREMLDLIIVKDIARSSPLIMRDGACTAIDEDLWTHQDYDWVTKPGVERNNQQPLDPKPMVRRRELMKILYIQ